jgi:hypothetical protein
LDWYRDLIDVPEGLKLLDAESLVTRHKMSAELEELWIMNYVANKTIHPIEPSERAVRASNKVAILIGGSPAIKKNLHHLAGLNDDFVIIPCNTSLKATLNAGVTPTYVFAVEGRNHIYDDMDIERDDLTLIASPFISNKTLRNWKGPVKFFIIGGGEKWEPYLKEDLGGKHEIDISGGNVVSTAMLWAHKFLRIRHFIFMGLSFCYYGNGDGYYHDDREVRQIENEMKVWDWMNVMDIYGQFAKSTYPLILYKQWLESYTRYIIQYGGSITNSTEDGIFGVLPEVIKVEDTRIHVQPKFLPWISILPLKTAIEVHKSRMEAQNGSNNQL